MTIININGNLKYNLVFSTCVNINDLSNKRINLTALTKGEPQTLEHYQNEHVIKRKQIKESGKKIIVNICTEFRHNGLLSSECAF